MQAVLFEQFHIAKHILSLGADINFMNSDNETALTLSLKTKKKRAIGFLLVYNSDKSHENDEGIGYNSCLHRNDYRFLIPLEKKVLEKQ